MSIIAISEIPFKWNIKGTVKNLVKIIKGPYEALNFDQKRQGSKQFPTKTLYLRLCATLDPQVVLESINSHRVIQGAKLRAFIPNHVPDLPLAISSKGKKPPMKKGIRMKHTIIDKPEDIIALAHGEIMSELQYKYTGLYELSKQYGHTLLEEITHTIFERLKGIMDAKDRQGTSIYYLTQGYRRSYPHFGDFQLILSTLEKVQDAAGSPRTPVTEQEISAVKKQPEMIANIPYNKVKAACDKYSNAIVKNVTDHVKSLDSDIRTGTYTEEEIARKKVRGELKKLEPYLPTMIRQIITDNFVPERTPYHKFRIYGEPFLPPKEATDPFLRRYKPVKVNRSDRMFNLLRFYISLANYGSIMAMNGTVIGGAKLVIRPSEQVMYKVPDSFIKEMRQAVTVGYKPAEVDKKEQVQEQPSHEPTLDNWNDPWE